MPGSESTKDMSVSVTHTQPMIQTLVKEGEGWQKDTVHVEIKAWDSVGEAGIQSLICYVGQQEVCNLQRKSGEQSRDLTADIVISQESFNGEGVLLTVRAADFVGNIREVSKKIYIDRTAPSITLDTSGEAVNTSAQIKVYVTDNNLVAEQQTEINFKNTDGKEQKIEFHPEGILSEEGSYTITVKALDGAGNSAQITKQIIIDKTPPAVRYVQSMEDMVIPFFQWNYKTEEVIWDYLETKEKILLDGKNYQSGERIVEEGRHELVIEAVDSAGNQRTEKAGFFIDCTPPNIFIQNIESGGTYEKGHIVSICTEKKGEWLTNIRMNGQQLTLEENTKIFEYRLCEPGEYRLEAEAQDAARNKSTTELEFRVVSDVGKNSRNTGHLTKTAGLVLAGIAAGTVLVKKVKHTGTKKYEKRK